MMWRRVVFAVLCVAWGVVAHAQAIVGSQTLLVIPVNAANAPVESYTATELAAVFAEADTHVRAFSYGVASLAVTIRPWATYPGSVDLTTCTDLPVLTAWATDYAESHGYAPADYAHVVLVTPVFQDCGVHAPTGPTPPLMGRFSLGGALHALTHAFGLSHSRGEACHVTTAGVTTCTVHKGGETISVTGSSLAGPPALDKRRLHWIDQPGRPTSVTGALGLFVLEPFEAPLTPGGVVALIVPASDHSSWLVIEAHTRPVRSPVIGVVLRRATVVDGVPDPASNVLLDLDPITSASKTMLFAGEVFVDPVRRVIIAVESLTPDGAIVLVTPCDGTCPSPPPPPPPDPPPCGRTCPEPPPPGGGR